MASCKSIESSLIIYVFNLINELLQYVYYTVKYIKAFKTLDPHGRAQNKGFKKNNAFSLKSYKRCLTRYTAKRPSNVNKFVRGNFNYLSLLD